MGYRVFYACLCENDGSGCFLEIKLPSYEIACMDMYLKVPEEENSSRWKIFAKMLLDFAKEGVVVGGMEMIDKHDNGGSSSKSSGSVLSSMKTRSEGADRGKERESGWSSSSPFVYKKLNEKGWKEHVDNMEAAREMEKVLTLRVDPEKREKWIRVVVVVASNTDNGWKWVIDTVKEHFGVKGTLYTNNFAVDRGILFLTDMKAKARMLDRGAIMGKGTQISLAVWTYEVNKFEECFFTKVERWVHLHGL